jgi:CxxC motif-containing protein (DUF1111 family)
VITLLNTGHDRNKRFLLFALLSVIANLCQGQANPFDVSAAGLDYLTGQALFEKNWVSAPASTQASDGLGPLYNARSCAQCHIEAGKGTLPNGLIFRINDSYLGRQIQTRAVAGLPAEAQVEINYSTQAITLDDNTVVLLQEPHYVFSEHIQLEEAQSEIDGFSARLAPALYGLGLLEEIPADEIAARADPEDRNNDGISGKVGAGRFGWKADLTDLEQQTALALSLDLGVSSELFPAAAGDCTAWQEDCLILASSHGHELEIAQAAFESLVAFVRNVPAVVAGSDEQEAGREIFENIGCLSCHQTGYMQGMFNPYSDLLLHDMGDGLSDSLDDELAREWRTAPLWGLSTYSRAAEQFYLHDGRARNLLEAILWHGGEAENARKAFMALSAEQREDLINFLQSL